MIDPRVLAQVQQQQQFNANLIAAFGLHVLAEHDGEVTIRVDGEHPTVKWDIGPDPDEPGIVRVKCTALTAEDAEEMASQAMAEAKRPQLVRAHAPLVDPSGKPIR